MSNLALIEKYFRSIESGDLNGMLACYDESAVQTELPNAIKPAGDRRTVSDLARDFERGRALLSHQSYEIESALEDRDETVVRVLWHGTLAIPLGTLRSGDVMRVQSAIFFKIRNGLILSQTNYDCCDPVK